MSTDNCAIVIAGTLWQKSLVEFLQSKGHEVWVVNPIKTETTKLANHICCDVRSPLLIYNAIIERDLCPKIIVSDQCDIACDTVSILSKWFGLPFNDLGAVQRFSTDKGMMYEYSRTLDIPVLEFESVHSSQEVRRFCASHGLPVVLKPSDATNSRGFAKIDNEDQIEEAVNKCLSFSKNKKIIVQIYCQSDMQLTVEGVILDGHHTTLAISQKGDYWNPSLTKWIRWPARAHPDLLDSIKNANDRFADKSGVKFAITHGEYLVRENKFWLNEIACRGGGFRISSDIVPWITSLNLYECLYSSWIGGSTCVLDQADLKQRSAILKFYDQSQVGSLCTSQVNEIQSLPGVSEFNWNFRGADYVKDEQNVRHTYGIYFAECDDELDALDAAIEGLIKC